MQIKLLQFLRVFAVLLWAMVGVIGNIYLPTSAFAINIVMGSVFILVGQFVFWKEKYFIKLLKELVGQGNKKLKTQIVIGEAFFLVAVFLVGLGMFFGVFSRVFLEGFAVFG